MRRAAGGSVWHPIWGPGVVAAAGLLLPGLGYALSRRLGLAAATMSVALVLALLALRAIPSPFSLAAWWPLVGAYVALWWGTALHAAASTRNDGSGQLGLARSQLLSVFARRSAK